MNRFLAILVLLILPLSFCNLFAQEQAESNANNSSTVFVEFGGNAPLVSLNYDYLIQTKKENFKYALTFGATHHFNNIYDVVLAPQFNALIGKALMAEMGGGVTIPIAYIKDWVCIPRLGLRYQKINGGMFYKLAFTPIIPLRSNSSVLPMFGVAIGYTYKCNKKIEH